MKMKVWLLIWFIALQRHVSWSSLLQEQETSSQSCSCNTATRQTVSSGAKWEDLYGYSRAVRVKNMIYVAGTVASVPNNQVVGVNDAQAQATFILTEKIPQALQKLNANMTHVVRTRVYVPSRDHADAVARVHGQVFADIRPVSTLVIAQLIEEEYLVEIEVDAIIDDDKGCCQEQQEEDGEL